MLSIGAMGHGQGAYYVGLAHEDYYLEGGEPPGVWHGAGAEDVGLDGIVEGEKLTRLLEGFHPDSGEALIRNAGAKNHKPGWDLTFSAPKSVSVLWSQASPELRGEIQKAQLAAVRAALDYLAETALITRRGKGGTNREPGRLVAATFEHGTSRAQDPQIHIHALVINVCTRVDGTTGALESKHLYRAKMAAGALYRAELSHQLGIRLGLLTQRLGSTFEVLGVPAALIREFSKRRAEIEHSLEARGFSGAVASAAATIHTRKVKEHLPREHLFEGWQQTGKTLGWSQPQTKELLGKVLPRNPSRELRVALPLATERSTEPKGSFTEREFVRCIAEECQGRGVGAQAIRKAAADHLAKSPDILSLGRSNGELLYTTREMMQLEAYLLTSVDRSRHFQAHGVSAPLVQNVAATKALSEEQAKALRHLAGHEGRIRLVSGVAGTEKLLHAARMAWELEGFKVYGATVSAKASRGLKDRAGIQCESLERTLADLQRGRLKLDRQSILVVAEADLLGPRQIKKLVDSTERSFASLVLVGEERPVLRAESPGVFAELERRLRGTEPSPTGTEHGRSRSIAVSRLVDGQSLMTYADQGRLTVTEGRQAAVTALVEAWKVQGLRAPREQLIVSDRKSTPELNSLAQEARAQMGALGKESIPAPGGGVLRAGDRVVFPKASRTLGIEGGSFGEVASLDVQRNQLFVRLDTGTRVRVPLGEYEHLRLGYAVSAGNEFSAKRSFVLAGGSLTHREIPQLGETVQLFADQAEVGERVTELARARQASLQAELSYAPRKRVESASLPSQTLEL